MWLSDPLGDAIDSSNKSPRARLREQPEHNLNGEVVALLSLASEAGGGSPVAGSLS